MLLGYGGGGGGGGVPGSARTHSSRKKKGEGGFQVSRCPEGPAAFMSRKKGLVVARAQVFAPPPPILSCVPGGRKGGGFGFYSTYVCRERRGGF